MRRLLPVAVVVVVMMTSTALGVVRAQGVWSTAQLSVGRAQFAAASVGNVALFAGGVGVSALLCRDWGVRSHLLLRFARAAVLRLCLPCDRFLSHARHCRW